MKDAAIEEHIAALLSILEEHAVSFTALPSDCRVDIWCTISSHREFVGFSLPRESIVRAARLGVEFIFSVYKGENVDLH